MNDEKQFVFQLKDDTLTEAAERQDFLSFRSTNGRIERPQDEWTANADFLNRLIEDALRERLDVNGDVREFRHVRKDEGNHGGLPLQSAWNNWNH